MSNALRPGLAMAANTPRRRARADEGSGSTACSRTGGDRAHPQGWTRSGPTTPRGPRRRHLSASIPLRRYGPPSRGVRSRRGGLPPVARLRLHHRRDAARRRRDHSGVVTVGAGCMSSSASRLLAARASAAGLGLPTSCPSPSPSPGTPPRRSSTRTRRKPAGRRRATGSRRGSSDRRRGQVLRPSPGRPGRRRGLLRQVEEPVVHRGTAGSAGSPPPRWPVPSPGMVSPGSSCRRRLGPDPAGDGHWPRRGGGNLGGRCCLVARGDQPRSTRTAVPSGSRTGRRLDARRPVVVGAVTEHGVFARRTCRSRRPRHTLDESGPSPRGAPARPGPERRSRWFG